jgi:biopolymer transport protein ExbD
MAMSMGGSKGGPSSDMNVTPLIDVLLVLLIIFMVITPLTPKGLEALVPQPPPPNQKNQEINQSRTIVVQVLRPEGGAQPKLKINMDDATWTTLQSQLTDIFKARAEKIMFVKADDDLTFEWVAQVIDIAHASGVDKVGLITAKIESGN